MSSRREFLGTAAAAAAGFSIASDQVLAQRASRAAALPIVVGSSNGITSGGGTMGVKVAYDKIVAGADTLDAIIAGVNVVELDPNDQSVGLGGLPNEDGVVQLDASCMHGPTRRAGAVACLEDIATPSLVAKAVMDNTDHIMLVGADAKKFAIKMGFKTQNLLTEKSKADWLKWKASASPGGWLDPARRSRSSEPAPEGVIPWTHGTINMNAINAKGEVSSVTTTSGMSWKIPGRVGDSPIIGAGQYCDNDVGAAGSTGRGEANIKVCGAFLAVELMRQGKSPEQALITVMQRVIAMTEKRLLGANGRPLFDLTYYAVNKKGEFAGACAYEGTDFAVCDAQGPRRIKCAYLYKQTERPKS
ncbi:MAG TPA: N(4)-(beta-N-acetylglucosaminyl)-L-asparaginase [Gemmatimonadaceae bacterium]|nr:N(4)-(beta-N-acetylglucosaminyl)-L-asparaginase [Gemmatimonadaceae bacterium]